MKLVKGFLSSIFHHKRKAAILIVVIIVIGFLALPKNTTPIVTATVKRQSLIQSISATGTVESESTVNLNFLIAGKLVFVGVKKGVVVTKGQTIATLDQRGLQKNVQQSLRDYAKQKNAYDTTSDANQHHTPIDALSDSMRRVLENNQGDLEKALVSVELQQLTLEQSTLTTPIAGVVTRADVIVPGANITAATTYTVADPVHLLFKMDVDESDIGKITQGQQIQVILDSFPDDTVTLQVSSVDFASHKSDTGGNVYTVEATMPDNTSGKYRIGMTGDAQIELARTGEVLTVPLSSIEDDKYIYVKNGKSFEKRLVKIGLMSDTDAEIVSGVSLGEDVAIDPETASKITKK